MAVTVATILIVSVQKWKTFLMVTGECNALFYHTLVSFYFKFGKEFQTFLITFRYCHECMNKATGERNCLVCGKRAGKNLVLCELCPRAYHTDCHNPVMPKVSNCQNILLLKMLLSDKVKRAISKHRFYYVQHSTYRYHEENGIALIATVNNQRREIVVEGVIPKGEAPEKVKVLIIHQLGDYVKNKQTLSSCWLNDVSCEVS